MKGHMKRKVGLKSWAMLLAGAFVLGSCVEDEVLENNEDLTPREAISFDAVVEWPEDYIEGRGAVIEKANLSSFNVWATLTRDASVEGAPIAYFSDVVFSKQGTENRFASATTYYWPGEGPTLDFVAVGGRPSATAFTAQRNSSTNKVESFTYTVPVDATLQNDVVVAETDPIPGNNTALVPLDFQHIMSQVNVMIGTDTGLGTINSITFKGIKNKATYNVATPAWTIASDATTPDYPVTLAADGDDNAGYTIGNKLTTSTQINATNATMMLIPQTLSEATVEVSFTPKGSTAAKTLTADISGEWVMGKVYNYILNINPSLDLTLTLQVLDWNGVTIENNFADNVSVNRGDEIQWTTDGLPTITNNNVILTSGIATFTFKIAGPKGGTWNAVLVTQQGNPNAFNITPSQGKVGDVCTVTITTDGENNTRVANVAELRLVVRQGGKILPVDNLTYYGENNPLNGTNYLIVQNPVIN